MSLNTKRNNLKTGFGIFGLWRHLNREQSDFFFNRLLPSSFLIFGWDFDGRNQACNYIQESEIESRNEEELIALFVNFRLSEVLAKAQRIFFHKIQFSSFGAKVSIETLILKKLNS